MTTRELDAIVIGGGIAGTAAAIALRIAGRRPVIHEAHGPGDAERGVFVTIAVNGVNALRSLGADPAVVLARGFATPRLALRRASGRLLAELPLGGPTPDGTVTTTIRRADLYAALRAEAERQGIEIVYGHRLVTARSGPHGVTAEFANGRAATGDLLVGADGLNSRTRTAMDPSSPAPHFLGLLDTGGFTDAPVDPALVPPPGVMQMSFGRKAFFGWAAAPDGRVWWFANPPRKRPVEPGEFTAESWRAHLLGLFEGEPGGDLIRATGEILGPWSTRDLPRVPVWHDDRMVLAGDAAHAVAPSSGQGASMALEDAVVLGHSLREHRDQAALAAYEAARRPRVEKVVAHGRRSSSTKVAGPVGAAIRDAMTPLVMRMLHRRGDPQAWIFEHRVPVLARAPR
ncbi:FAD-dependent oxidoreductase [Actinoplanes philippinensis]|uniref:2-polyprenyl-6-methoxyphenol hydroxylase n=1 Tax=Actinoplanes philippinensis TaxID=35752 RepID=A0A1I2IYU1_9ACTN|nr:NAD(P)/FAD-dependent oxidoreductase [Actinoplanes philippinensis]GIE79771.1 FAD-dependent oxidoreductase [Actinoplanes philippinensis]SFF47605.1 2-polyprenyl-6-methoxyphenol hydroxylase [Actinoplanes philippinensis]